MPKRPSLKCECGRKKDLAQHECCARCAVLDGINLYHSKVVSAESLIVSIICGMGGHATRAAIMTELGEGGAAERLFYRGMAKLVKSGRVVGIEDSWGWDDISSMKTFYLVSVDDVVVERSKPDPVTVTCKWCKRDFSYPPIAGGSKRAFCSKKCKWRYYDRKRRRACKAATPTPIYDLMILRSCAE